MIKIYLAFLLFISTLMSCKTASISKHITSNSNEKKSNPLELDNKTLRLIITSDNLSEDMSRLSSKNDEVLLLFYSFSENNILDIPKYSEKFILDKNNIKTINLNDIDKNEKFILFMLEQDSETPIEQIDSIIRINYRKLIEIFNDKDYSEIEKYLGDEDILGIKIIDFNDSDFNRIINMQGTHRLDNYNYSIKIE